MILFVDEHQHRFWPQLRVAFEPDTLSGTVTRWVAAGRADGTVAHGVRAEVQAALVLGLTSQCVAMRHEGLVPEESAAELPVLVRRALHPSSHRSGPDDE